MDEYGLSPNKNKNDEEDLKVESASEDTGSLQNFEQEGHHQETDENEIADKQELIISSQ